MAQLLVLMIVKKFTGIKIKCKIAQKRLDIYYQLLYNSR
jgi:hypothetical protein